MNLSSSPKVFQNYKCDTPKNTIKKIENGFKKLDLEISYLEKEIKTSDFSIYSGHALVDILGWSQHGKGITSILSKASAYAELAERFSTGFMELKMPLPKNPIYYQNLFKYCNERRFLKGYTEITDDSSVSFEKVSCFFDKDFTNEEFNVFVSEGLLKSIVEAYSTIDQKYKKIPISLIELKSTSNGIASGNTLEEAVAQASFEIFERYSSYITLNKKKICPTIDPNTIDDEQIQKCINLFRELNINVLIKDFTFGNKIPVVGILFIDNNAKDYKNILKRQRDYHRVGFASHLNLKEAILRCFTESIQFLDLEKEEIIQRKKLDLLYNSWTRDIGKKYVGMTDEYKYFTREYNYYRDLIFLTKGDIVSFDSLKINKVTSDSYIDLKEIEKICIKNSWDLLVLDFTHKILNFPTVRVIIPPISISFDNFIKNFLSIKNFDKKIELFYGIKEFYTYLRNDKWLNNSKKIEALIHNIEKYLSHELDHYFFYINRANNFSQYINLLHILPFLYMAINEYKIAKKYFEVLIKLEFKPPIKSSYFKSLFLNIYNVENYKIYIELINRHINGKKRLEFKLDKNPFDADSCDTYMEKLNYLILQRAGESFEG